MTAFFGLKLGGALVVKQLNGFVLQPDIALVIASTNTNTRIGDFATQRSEIGGEAWTAIPKQVQVLVLRKQYLPIVRRTV